MIDYAYSSCALGSKKSDTFCGTFNYMCPELIKRQSHCPKKADVWAFGVIAYQMLVGKLPFEGRLNLLGPNKEATESLIIKGEFPTEKTNSFSRSINNFLRRTIEVDPEKRNPFKEVKVAYFSC